MGVVIGKMDGQVEKIFLGNNLTRSTKNYAKILKDKDLSEEEKKRIMAADTILTQLGAQDEVIVSVDGASDGSKPLLLKMAEEDKRIHVIKGPGKGVVKNFENAIRHCSGEIIYLSDQDDIWKSDKVKKVNEAFLNPKVKAVLHDAQIVDE